MIEFIHTIQQSHNIFYSTQYKAIYNDHKKSFVELITKFEDFTKSKHGRSTYTTFRGNNTNSNKSNKNKPTPQDRPCPYNQPKSIHPKQKNYKYYNKNIHKDDQTPDPKITRKITENATRYKPLRDFIQKNKKKAPQQPTVNINTIFTTSSSSDPLVNSIIHNSSATESISNNHSHIKDFIPERIHIQGFRGSIQAKERGTIVI